MTFKAPVKDLLFNIAHIAPWSGDPAYDLEIVGAVLEEFGRFCVEEIAHLNASGDRAGSRCEGGQVHTPPGFPQAYAKFMAMGWQGLVHPSDYGGQDLPRAVGAAAGEIINAANMSFALCPLLTDGAIDALHHFGSPQMQQTYLPKLVSGAWTGTMNLTEPQAGSDLALLRTRAERQVDGSYQITGTKIFITYGDHDLTENIIHLVLARTPDAPKGVKGISLFLVPKRLAEDGAPNAVRCQSIEHKLGVRASPTCVLAFEGATGFLIGRENAGLEYMFTMMNAARFAVGVQGVAIGERAYQLALSYARTRHQGRPVDGSAPEAVAIIQHPDVRRMLAQMRATTEGCRALAAFAAGCQVGPRPQARLNSAPKPWPWPSSWCRWSRGSAPKRAWRPPHWACKSTAAWALSRKPGLHSTTAMHASCQSMKAQPPFRPMTCLAARRCATAGRSRGASPQ